MQATVPNKPAGQGFYPTKTGIIPDVYSGDVVDGPYLSLRSSWKLWHNAVDLELRRLYFVAPRVSIQTHWGVRGAILKQRFDTTFSTPGTISRISGSGTFVFGGETVRVLNKFWGVGPRLCVDANWHLGKGFSLIGRGAVATLFGQTKWHSLALVVPFGSNVAVTGAKSGGMFQTLVPNLQLFFGLEWSHCFRDDKVFFGLKAGWETNCWWNQNAIVTMMDRTASNSPVTMEGLTVNAHFDF